MLGYMLAVGSSGLQLSILRALFCAPGKLRKALQGGGQIEEPQVRIPVQAQRHGAVSGQFLDGLRMRPGTCQVGQQGL